MSIRYNIIILIIFHFLFGSEPTTDNNASYHPWSQFSNNGGTLGKLGDYGYPTNPMNDRAFGFLFNRESNIQI